MKRGSHLLPVMESFYSIQGEGYHSGKPAFFVRLAGCNVKCTWCDVKESWSIYENQFFYLQIGNPNPAKGGDLIFLLNCRQYQSRNDSCFD